LDGNYTINYYGKRATQALQKFAIGPLFNNIVRLMKLRAAGQSAVRYAQYSGHDSTLTAVNAVLDVAHEWPPYASYRAFELWRDDASGGLYVQLLGDGRVLQPPLFGASAPPMLPFAAFVRALAPVLLDENDWRVQCGIQALAAGRDLVQ
jgi:hypothetical protein